MFLMDHLRTSTNIKRSKLSFKIKFTPFYMQAGVCLWELVNKSKGVWLDREIINLVKKVDST